MKRGDIRQFTPHYPTYTPHLRGTHLIVIEVKNECVRFMTHDGKIYSDWSVDYMKRASRGVEDLEAN